MSDAEKGGGGTSRPDGRVSLHPLTFEEALEAVLATPKDAEDDADAEGDDDGNGA